MKLLNRRSQPYPQNLVAALTQWSEMVKKPIVITPEMAENALKEMPDGRNKDIVLRRFKDQALLADVAKEQNLSKERVRQLETQGLFALYKIIKSKL